MAGSFRWNDDAVKAIKVEMRHRLDACANRVINHAKVLIGVEGAGEAGERVRRVRSKKTGRLTRSKKKIYGKYPSRPGEPPHKQTSRLFDSVTKAWAGQFTIQVGTNVPYGKWLEFGTSDGRLAARPWLRRALAEKQKEINNILGKPMKP